MKVFSKKTQAITLLLATTATLLFVIKTHYEASRSTDVYMGNLRHSHLAPHDILAAEAEPFATTAPSVKLQKEAGNVSLHRSESEVAPDLPSSSAPRNHDNVTLRPESKGLLFLSRLVTPLLLLLICRTSPLASHISLSH